MPLMPFPLQDISVVGMSGIPVQGGAGIKPPIFRDEKDQKFFSLGRTPPQRYDAQEIESYEQQGLLARTQATWKPVDTGVILYAHRQFVEPGPDLLKLDPSALRWDEKLDIWVMYERRDKAMRCLEHWGDALIHDATERLREAAKQAFAAEQPLVDRALDDARRARYCAPPPEHSKLRARSFECWAAAWILQGRPIDALLRDARRDFPNNETIEQIEKNARHLATPETATYPASKSRNRLSWAPRVT
jgi:hypothetical protein